MRSQGEKHQICTANCNSRQAILIFDTYPYHHISVYMYILYILICIFKYQSQYLASSYLPISDIFDDDFIKQIPYIPASRILDPMGSAEDSQWCGEIREPTDVSRPTPKKNATSTYQTWVCVKMRLILANANQWPSNLCPIFPEFWVPYFQSKPKINDSPRPIQPGIRQETGRWIWNPLALKKSLLFFKSPLYS
jgi:hypothetical protein